jgi:hypothetical protein
VTSVRNIFKTGTLLLTYSVSLKLSILLTDSHDLIETRISIIYVKKIVEFATFTVVVLSLFDMFHVTFCHCLFEKPVPTKIYRKRLKLHKYLTPIFHIFLLVFTVKLGFFAFTTLQDNTSCSLYTVYIFSYVHSFWSSKIY